MSYGLNHPMERAVLRQAIGDPTVLPRLARHLRPDGFSQAPVRLALAAALALLKLTGRPPTAAAILQEIRDGVARGKRTNDELRAVADVIEASREEEGAPSEYVVRKILTVERDRQLEGALDLAIKMFGEGRRDDIEGVIARAASVGKAADQVLGTDHRGTLAQRTQWRLTYEVPPRWGTGIPELDDMTEGGLSADNPLGCVLAPPKGGKCHRRGQPILMHNGSIKRVEDVVVGDRLMGPDGFPRRVLVTSRGRGQMFDVVPNRGGEAWGCNADHVLTLAATGTRGRSDYAGVVVDVSVREYLTWPRHRRARFKLLRARVDAFGPRFRRIGLMEDLPPYCLGILLGDGSMTHTSVGITTADPEVGRAMGDLCEIHGLDLAYGGARGAARSWRLAGRRGRANPVMKLLRGLGLRGRSSGDKFIPDDYRLASREERLALLAGLVDTDGHLSRNGVGREHYEYVSKSRRLADDVAFVARSLGFSCRVRAVEKGCQTGARGIYYRLNVTGDIWEIPVRVPRKRARRKPAGARRRDPLKTGFQIVARGEEDYFGFTLDGDARYLLGDFTVTHNSLFLARCALHHAERGGYAVYFSLENGERETHDRIDAAISGVPMKQLYMRAREVEEKVSAFYARVPGGIHVKKYKRGSKVSCRDFDAYLQELRAQHDVKPTLIVFDYWDEMSAEDPNRYDGRHEELEAIGHEMAGLCEKHGAVGWTASRVTKDAVAGGKRGGGKGDVTPTAQVFDVTAAAGSFAKANVVDLLVAIMRTPEERVAGKIRFAVVASRFSQDVAPTAALPSAFNCGQIVVPRGAVDAPEVPS